MQRPVGIERQSVATMICNFNLGASPDLVPPEYTSMNTPSDPQSAGGCLDKGSAVGRESRQSTREIAELKEWLADKCKRLTGMNAHCGQMTLSILHH